MLSKKSLAAISSLLFCLGTTFAYEELDCSSDNTFSGYSCDQCFDGGTKDTGSNIGFLSDDWINPTNSEMILYKEEQDFPEIFSLDPENVEISIIPSNEDFWEYTDEFNSLYSEKDEGYLLPAGDKITWIKSKTGYAYSIDKNTAPKDFNIAMIVYPIITHEILSDGEPTIDSKEHRECVIFKSGKETKKEEITPTPVKKLPSAGAEHILLIILAVILGFGAMKFRKKI